MAQKKIDLNKIRYLAFEGGGGKGQVYIGAIAALEHEIYRQEIQEQQQNSTSRQSPPGVMELSDFPLFDLNIALSDRPFAGVSGASAGAVTALFLAMGLTSRQMFKESQAIAKEDMLLGSAFSSFLSETKVSPFEKFFEKPNVTRNIEVAPTPNERKYFNQFTGDEGISTAAALAAYVALLFEINDNPSLAESILIRRLFLSDGVAPIGTEPVSSQLYFQSLLTNRGLFTAKEARKYFRDIVQRLLIDIRPDWNVDFPDIPAVASTLTFRQFAHVTGVDLILTGSNTSRGLSLPFSAGATPDFPVVEAIIISMNIPIVFKPIWVNTIVNKDPKDSIVDDLNSYYTGLWVDGGMLNNFPRHEFKYVVLVDGITYKGGTTLLPVAVPWKYFDVSDATLVTGSDQVLGFALLSTDLDIIKDPFKENNKWIDFGFLERLLTSMLNASTEGQFHEPDDRKNTISLNSSGIGVLDFAGAQLARDRGQEDLAWAIEFNWNEAYSKTNEICTYRQ